jgi:hypothetical protein
MSTSLIDILSRGKPTIGVYTGRARNLIELDHLSFKYIFERSSTASNRNRVGADEGETIGRIIADKGATVGRTTVVPTIAMVTTSNATSPSSAVHTASPTKSPASKKPTC